MPLRVFRVEVFSLPTKVLDNSKNHVRCFVRNKWLVLTPEEWVRQQILVNLVTRTGYVKSRFAVEKQLFLNGLRKRFDIVYYNKQGKPTLLIECKAPEVDLSQATFNQAARYNLVMKVPYLAISNFRNTLIAAIYHDTGDSKWMDNWPNP